MKIGQRLIIRNKILSDRINMSKQQQNNIYKMKYFFVFYFSNNHIFIFNKKKWLMAMSRLKKKYNAGKNVVHIVRKPGKI